MRDGRHVPEAPLPYINRELSWLEFNARVLHEARDQRNPLLERVKFLTIFASNLDEFFQVRVAGLRQQVQAGKAACSPDGRTAEDQLAAIRERVLELTIDHSRISSTSARRSPGRHRDRGLRRDPAAPPGASRTVPRGDLPVLTPLAVDPGHPFPYISTLSLSIAVGCAIPRAASAASRGSRSPRSCPA